MKTIVAILFVLTLSIPAYAASDWTFGLDGGLSVPTQNYFPTNTGDAGTGSLPYFQALEASEGPMVSLYVLHRVGPRWFHLGLLGSWEETGASAVSPVTPGIINWSMNPPTRGQYYEGSGVKTNLGMIETWEIMPYLRINPWTFGNVTPFFGLGIGISFNQWNTQFNSGIGSFSAKIDTGLPIRIELGADYRVGENLSLESLIGFQQQDPLGSVNLPYNAGGMDQEFNMSLFFVEVGFQFGF